MIFFLDRAYLAHYTKGTPTLLMKGKELRALRDKLGWTQVQLAKALEVTENTVARWERDERAITKPIAKLIDMVYANEKRK